MRITVKLFATLRENREKIFEMEIQEGDTPYEVIQAIGINHEEVAILMINGRGVEMNASLADQDVLALFPAVGGG